MAKTHSEPLLIGVDGGASEVKAHEIVALEHGVRPLFALGPASASVVYDRADGFEPLPLDVQLDERARGALRLAPGERVAAHGRIDAVASAIGAIVEQAGGRRALVGLCMPGLKTPDGRGIAVLKNGPRCPDYLDRLEAALARRGLPVASPIAALSSDAVACGVGEDVAARGAFRDVGSALYIGGGTGLAEVAKLGGRIVSFDELSGVLAKGWQLASETGATFEERLAVSSINLRFARAAGLAAPLADGSFPEQRAARGDETALFVFEDVAEALAELTASRVASLVTRGVVERVVVGQRLGALLVDSALKGVLRERAEAALARRLQLAHADVRAVALDPVGALRPGYLAPSLLREAPAIGAAALAIEIATGAVRGR